MREEICALYRLMYPRYVLGRGCSLTHSHVRILDEVRQHLQPIRRATLVEGQEHFISKWSYGAFGTGRRRERGVVISAYHLRSGSVGAMHREVGRFVQQCLFIRRGG
jgi:hypothetical protein